MNALWRSLSGAFRLGRGDEARDEVKAIERLPETQGISGLLDAGMPGPDVLAISARIIEARLAQRTGNLIAAADKFAEVAQLQDRLPYMEPPFWYYPVHQSLGAVLLEQGKVAEAQTAFRAALDRAPSNGWAASGLLRTAERLGDQQLVDEARALMKKSWFGEDAPSIDRL